MGALAILLQGAASAAPVSLSFYLEYSTDQENPLSNGYVLFPGLGTSVPRTTVTSVESPGGPAFSSELNPGEGFSGGSSTVFSTFGPYKAEIGGAPWTLTADADTAAPATYTFNVDASALTNWVTTPFLIGPGQQGSIFAQGSSPTFTWTGLTGYDNTRVQLFDGTLTVDESANPGPGVTSYTAVGSLIPGSYTFLVSYEKDWLNSPLSVTTPTNAGGPYADWGGLQLTQTIVTDRISFTVVPEPGGPVLLLGGLAGIGLIRRRRIL